MGTKINPGKFDCYANAKPEEPMFVLLGRDPTAGATVRLWCRLRERAGMGGESEMLDEAKACARAMDGYAVRLGKSPLLMPAVAESWAATTLGDLRPALNALFQHYRQIEPDGDRATFAAWVADEMA